MIPDDIIEAIEVALSTKITSSKAVSGGSINKAGRITLADEENYFVKWNHNANADMFPKEEKGLKLLYDAGTKLRIPKVKTTGTLEDGTGFLVQEYLAEGKSNSDSPQIFGHELAKLHQNTSSTFGLGYDNYIGKLPQSNKQHERWTTFFIEERMQPQLEWATKLGLLNDSDFSHFESLFTRLDEIFPDERPSLLHGDLWGGNFFYDQQGVPAIYDPAVYYGNREIELAFTHLFGGFPKAFYDAYQDTFPLQPHFKQRIGIYNLYPLLVHTNLFGRSYARQVKSIISKF